MCFYRNTFQADKQNMQQPWASMAYLLEAWKGQCGCGEVSQGWEADEMRPLTLTASELRVIEMWFLISQDCSGCCTVSRMMETNDREQLGG